ncbi:MAG: ATP-binding protein, partial [Coleofasciculaceae cyanobacterium SM2_3_26]|nr:ATP-binding protein [Coleofasciculaceae cyanobacterium SM2_3_26]
MSSPPPAGCPFVAGSMITDPQCFVGRQEALKAIASRMAAHSLPASMWWASGASAVVAAVSLFQTWDRRIQPYGKNPVEYVVVYLSLQSAHCRKEMSFYEAVAKELLKRPAVSANTILVNALRLPPQDRM